MKYRPTPLPNPIPAWMSEIHYAFFTAGMPQPVNSIYCPPDGDSGEIRWGWWPKVEGGMFHTPKGQYVCEWASDSPRIAFSGEFAEKKVISCSGSSPIDCLVWIRFWDENGFMWDGPSVKVSG